MDTTATAHVADINMDPQAASTAATIAQVKEHHRYMTGKTIGAFISRNWCRIIVWIAMIITIALLLYLFYLTVDLQSCDPTVSIIQVGQHYRCKGTGGCGVDCPFAEKDDPRMHVRQGASKIAEMLVRMREMAKVAKTELQGELDTITKKESIDKVVGELNILDEQQKSCVINVSVCDSFAQKLAAGVAAEEVITRRVVDASNRIRALESLASIQAAVFSALIVRGSATIALQKLLDIPAVSQSKIQNYDELVYRCKAHINEIKESLDTKLVPFVRSSVVENTPYTINLDALVDTNSSQEQVLGALTFFLNTAETFHNEATEIINKQRAVQHILGKCLQTCEGFTNSLPNTIGSTEITKLIKQGDYNSALIKTALEPEVVINNHKFASERSSFDSGGGVPSVLDHDNDVNPWVGLFGRPSYRKARDGSSAEADNKLFPLKQIPSQEPDKIMRKQVPRFSMA